MHREGNENGKREKRRKRRSHLEVCESKSGVKWNEKGNRKRLKNEPRKKKEKER